jgi:hypothetical protein
MEFAGAFLLSQVRRLAPLGRLLVIARYTADGG